MVVVYMPEEKLGATFVIDPQGVVRHVHAGFNECDVGGESKKLKKALSELTK